MVFSRKYNINPKEVDMNEDKCTCSTDGKPLGSLIAPSCKVHGNYYTVKAVLESSQARHKHYQEEIGKLYTAWINNNTGEVNDIINELQELTASDINIGSK